MDKQQTLRRKVAVADTSCADNQAQKSLAAQPRAGAPHRNLELRNRITAGGARKEPAGRPAQAPHASASRREAPSAPRDQ